MESGSCSLLKGSLDFQANAVASVLAGGTQAAPLAKPADDSAARSAGMQAQGIGQKIDVVA